MSYPSDQGRLRFFCLGQPNGVLAQRVDLGDVDGLDEVFSRGKLRYRVAGPTPARRAMSSREASMPLSVQSSRAAVRMASKLRAASAGWGRRWSSRSLSGAASSSWSGLRRGRSEVAVRFYCRSAARRVGWSAEALGGQAGDGVDLGWAQDEVDGGQVLPEVLDAGRAGDRQ